MKNFTNFMVDMILENERPRLENIMQEVAKNIQNDMVAVTYSLVDAFYSDYTQPPRVYIRTDDYKKRHKFDAKGRKHSRKTGAPVKRSKTEAKRANDISLMSAVKALEVSGQPAIGICRPIDGVFGYQAGVVFDEGYFERNMKHTIKGNNFTEWDIVEDFLWGVHGNEAVYTTDPSAGWTLYEYLNSYKPKFDKHYNNALKKFK